MEKIKWLCLIFFVASNLINVDSEQISISINDIETYAFDENELENVTEDNQRRSTNTSRPYPPPTNFFMEKGRRKRSCPCKTILVSSLGNAMHLQPASMGIYKYYQEFNGKPAYYGKNNQRLYFLAGSGWLLGPTLGGHTGYIHNQDPTTICPYLITNIHWMYVFNNLWNYDPTLVVRCAD